MEDRVNLRLLRRDELADIVRIHINAFDGFFLTSLGESFLKTYYRAVLKSSDSILIGAFMGKELVGFSVGTVVAKGYNKKLILSHLFSFSWEGVKLIFGNPRAILQLKNNFNKVESDQDNGEYSELYSIAVAPGVCTRGIGSMMIQFFEQEAKKRGATRVSLTTDSCKNEKTLTFYSKNGYRLYYEFLAYPSRKMLRLIKQI